MFQSQLQSIIITIKINRENQFGKLFTMSYVCSQQPLIQTWAKTQYSQNCTVKKIPWMSEYIFPQVFQIMPQTLPSSELPFSSLVITECKIRCNQS